MTHLDDGVLRRMIDEPLSIRDTARRHYGECSHCQTRSTVIADDARWAHAVMAVTAANVDAAAALGRMQAQLARDGHARRSKLQQWIQPLSRSRLRSARTRMRTAVAGVAAVATLGGAFAWTPAGTLAQDLVNVFQPSQIVAVQVQVTDLQTLQQLSSYGTVTPPGNLKPIAVPDSQQASAQSGLSLLTPASLPSDIPHSPSYQIIPSETGSFTFSAAKAAASPTHAVMPAALDGSTLTVTTGAAVVATYKNAGDEIPGLLIGEMKAPTITTKGDSLQQMEDFLLNAPGVSPDLAAEIRAIGDPTQALPIPILVNRTYSQNVTVQGVQGLAVGDSTGAGAGIVWQKDGVIYGVGGPMSKDEALQIAQSLVRSVVSRGRKP